MVKYGNPAPREDLYSCELVPHPEGRIIIGGENYRPEWERTPVELDREFMRRMLSECVDAGEIHNSKRKSLPQKIKAQGRASSGMLTVKTE